MASGPQRRGRLLGGAALLGVGAVCAALVLGGGVDRAEAPRGAPNVLLISIDTLRADHLGCYGYGRDTSPFLDRFAARATRFARAYAPASWTLPSHVGLLTGRDPTEVGVRNRDDAIPSGLPLLAELLWRAGWTTAAFVDSEPGGFVGSRRGFARGFETFEHAPYEAGGREFDARASVDTALRWLDGKEGAAPFFLFLHLKDVHSLAANEPRPDARCFPYDAPGADRLRFVTEAQARFDWRDSKWGGGVRYLKGLNAALLDRSLARADVPPRDLEALKGLYDGGIAYVDRQLGRLLAALDARGVLAHTLVVVTADHGESFLEHDQLLHRETFDNVAHVPLLVALPGQTRARVVDRPVGTLDVTPSILRACGVATSVPFDGVPLPLGDLDETPAPPRRVFWCANLREERYRSVALRTGDWALVLDDAADAGRFDASLFRYTPAGEVPAPHADPDVRAALESSARAWLERALSGRSSASIELDDATIEHLAQLGYGG